MCAMTLPSEGKPHQRSVQTRSFDWGHIRSSEESCFRLRVRKITSSGRVDRWMSQPPPSEENHISGGSLGRLRVDEIPSARRTDGWIFNRFRVGEIPSTWGFSWPPPSRGNPINVACGRMDALQKVKEQRIIFYSNNAVHKARIGCTPYERNTRIS